jgi:hypothetical protein
MVAGQDTISQAEQDACSNTQKETTNTPRRQAALVPGFTGSSTISLTRIPKEVEEAILDLKYFSYTTISQLSLELQLSRVSHNKGIG